MAKLQSIIMAGGFGDRLWPRSNSFVPKQFIKLFAGRSPLQATIIRNKEVGPIAVIVHSHYKEIAKEQIEELGIDVEIIAEPLGKSTAPCAIIAALYAEYVNADKVILLPVDHYIRKHSSYLATIREAATYANNNNIITLGIKPLYPASGYGYLKTDKSDTGKFFKIEKFVEKPDIEDAAKYIKNGKYFWNSGMFIFNPKAIKSIAKRLEPNMFFSAKQAFKKRKVHNNIIELDTKSYTNIKGNSIDYAFMEKDVPILMLKGKFIWKDIGTWDSVWDTYDKDSKNNVFSGGGEVYSENVSGSLIHSDGIATAVIGVRDMIIVNTKNASLIMHKSQSEHIRKAKSFLFDRKKKKLHEANDND